jgi:hypothetical protein
VPVPDFSLSRGAAAESHFGWATLVVVTGIAFGENSSLPPKGSGTARVNLKSLSFRTFLTPLREDLLHFLRFLSTAVSILSKRMVGWGGDNGI